MRSAAGNAESVEMRLHHMDWPGQDLMACFRRFDTVVAEIC
jgi:hypothetical protein